MTPENKQELRNQLLVDAYLRAGLLKKAMLIPLTTITFDKYIACGDKCKTDKNYPDAFAAYRNANASAKLIELGDMCAKGKTGSQNHKIALDCFLTANATERLIKLGDKYLNGPFRQNDNGVDVTIALKAYSAAKATAKLIELGDACFENDRVVSIAFEAYKEAGAVEKLILLGDHLMSQQVEAGNSRNHTYHACNAYRAANAHDKMLLCANWYIQQGQRYDGIHYMQYGFEIYKEVGAELPMDTLNSILDHHIAEGRYDDAGCAASLIAKGLAKQEEPEEAVPSEEAHEQVPS